MLVSISFETSDQTTIAADAAAQACRAELIERNLALVPYTVNCMGEFLSSGMMEREDAIGYGTKGLIAAVDHFDATRGASFSTYAILRIRGAIIDAARQMDILTRLQRRSSRDLEQVNVELANDLGRWPTVRELSYKTGLPTKRVRTLQDQRGAFLHSLEQMTSSPVEGYEWEVEDEDESIDPAAVAEQRAVSVMLDTAMRSLRDRDRVIIDMRYNQELPFRVIGSHLNISESRVCQIHGRILVKLKIALEPTELAA